MAEALMDRLRWTGDLALAAANAFGTVCVLVRVYAHRADLGAASTVHTAFCVQRESIEAHSVEEAVKRAQWTEVAAERPRYHHRGDDDEHQYRKLPAEERSSKRAHGGICRHQR